MAQNGVRVRGTIMGSAARRSGSSVLCMRQMNNKVSRIVQRKVARYGAVVMANNVIVVILRRLRLIFLTATSITPSLSLPMPSSHHTDVITPLRFSILRRIIVNIAAIYTGLRFRR